MSTRPTLDRCICCAERELRMRIGYYKNRVISGRMTQAEADDELAAQREIVRLLKSLTMPFEPGMSQDEYKLHLGEIMKALLARHGAMTVGAMHERVNQAIIDFGLRDAAARVRGEMRIAQ